MAETTKIVIQENQLSDSLLQQLSEELSELISDETGFCHMGFSFEICVEAKLDKEDDNCGVES